ncbi:phosphatase PAP2 family protein [Cellulomonas xylanilytica]|uniref:Phosphatidic acid phosphatase n=1 Tax=Cellulomonas xylanilytica TaxID=233583 RepID=A0A510V6G4_9CELL|nr:phosphatase PAP2 family protein [Cellulomonas xylanilytica]GEK22457.1 phosphatidic acid phosphatase [Cellulomonas xylanilytica]
MSDAPTLPVIVRPAPDAGDRRGVVVAVAIGVAAASFAGVFLLWRVFVDTLAGQQVENAAFQGAQYGQTQLWRVAERVLDVVSVGFIVAVLIAAMLIAVLRRRWSLAAQVAVLMIGANLTTQVLKKWVLDRPDLGVEADYGNTLPSGHTTAAASVSAALLLVVPPRARPWAAVLGAGYTTATGVSTLIGQWHRPSDVVAAVLVVLAWTAIACALVALTPARPSTATGALRLATDPPPTPATMRGVVATLLIVGVGAGASAVVALSHTWQNLDDLDARAEQVTAYLGGAAGVLMASCLAFAVMLLLRQAAASRLPRG